MKGRAISLPFILVAILALGLPVAARDSLAESEQGSIRLMLETPAGLEIVRDEKGYDRIRLPGYASAGPPGTPLLPTIIHDVVLPPDVDWADLQVRVLAAEIEELPGAFDVAPAPPAATWKDGVQTLDWGRGEVGIAAGKDLAVYGRDAYYPERYVDTAGLSQMRKWKFARLRYTPVQVNPVTGRVRLVTGVEVELTFRRDPALVAEGLLADTVMDDLAPHAFLNYEQARDWYVAEQPLPKPQQTYDYVIITTNAIESGSSKLSSFVAHKQSQGFSVRVITQDEYGSLVGQDPNGTAEKIRRWLKDNYVAYGIEYVLLIGNPDPDDPSITDSVGDVPMKMCWPRRGEPDDYEESPTDYFYADLTGNWDLDGDLYFGEYNGDRETGGVDWANEVYVGRIPVYGTAYSTLDAILQKIIDYETESGDLSWRKAALLPMSFSDESTDGAYLGQAMKNDYLSPNGYGTYTLYQHKTTGCNSAFTSNQNLVGGAVESRWAANDYGLVNWWGHGSETGAYIGYTGVCEDGLILSSSDCPSLDDDHPAFVYQCSCTNGYPENSNNLGYALLKNGAITTVAASRVSWYAVTSWNIGLWQYADNASIGYYYDQRLVNNEEAAGEALFHVKSWMGASLNPSWAGASWMNLTDFNLYGDPSIELFPEIVAPDSPSGLTATAVSPNRINLAWTDNSTNESGFKIERSPYSPGSWAQIDTVGPNVTTYPDTGLSSNTTYYYRVRAWNASGDSGYSNQAYDTTLGGTAYWAYLPLVSHGYGGPQGWTNILVEGFEGPFPGPWNVHDGDGATNGEYYWAKRSCRAYAGSYSGWAVGGGADGGSLSCGSLYPNNARAWMIYGPFSLAGASAADLSYRLWLSGEPTDDKLCRLSSADGSSFSGWCTSGSTLGWSDKVLDLADHLGDSSVWIALYYETDSSLRLGEGAFVDDLVLRKYVGTAMAASPVKAPPDGPATADEEPVTTLLEP